MAAVMAAVIYVHQPGEGREYTADSAGSIWRQYISTELSGTTKCSTVQCCRATKEESAVFCQCFVTVLRVQCSVVTGGRMGHLKRSAVQCSAVQFSAVQCSAVQYSEVQYSEV